VGPNAVGDIVMYEQLVRRRSDGQWKWRFRNLTYSDLEPRDITPPLAGGELVSWVTPLNSLNIAFVDIEGSIQLFYKARNASRWSLTNLSQTAGTGPLIGELSVMQLRNGTIHIAGWATGDHVWVTTFRQGRGWSSRDLTEALVTPMFRARSLTTFVNKGGLGFIAGITPGGEVSMIKYQTARNRWVRHNIELYAPDFREHHGRLESTVDRDSGEINIVGTLDTTRVMRWSWVPGGTWTYQDVSYELARSGG
jgi:hypothetical protein